MNSRMARRHPKTPVESLHTTRAEVIAFADFIAKDPVWSMKVWATIQTTLHNEAVVAEHKKRLAWPQWRKWVHRKALELDGLRKRWLAR